MCQQILCLHFCPAVFSLLFTLFAIIPFGLASTTHVQPRCSKQKQWKRNYEALRMKDICHRPALWKRLTGVPSVRRERTAWSSWYNHGPSCPPQPPLHRHRSSATKARAPLQYIAKRFKKSSCWLKIALAHEELNHSLQTQLMSSSHSCTTRAVNSSVILPYQSESLMTVS